MTQELIYSEDDLRFAVRYAKTEIQRLTEQRNHLGECLRLLLSLHISAHNAVEHGAARKCLYNIFGDLK